MDSLQATLNERTRLLAITAVSNVLGTINPLAEIISLAHQQGALVLVDAAQAVEGGRTTVPHDDVRLLAAQQGQGLEQRPGKL